MAQRTSRISSFISGPIFHSRNGSLTIEPSTTRTAVLAGGFLYLWKTSVKIVLPPFSIITVAMEKAFIAVRGGIAPNQLEELTAQVLTLIEDMQLPGVEDIQNTVD